MEPHKNVANYISKTTAARRLGVTRHTLYDHMAAGMFALDERGRIIRADFDKAFPPRVAGADESKST